MGPTELLNKILLSEEERIVSLETKVPSPYSYFKCLELIRQIDFFYLGGKPLGEISDESWRVYRSYYQYGWFKVMKMFMQQLTTEGHMQIFVSSHANQAFVDLLIQNYGKVEIAKRIIQLSKAGLTKIWNDTDSKFFFSYIHEMSDAEYLDRQSFSFVKEVMKKIIKPKRVQHIKKYNQIKKQIKRTVQNPAGTFISYQTTPDIDHYFNKIGYFHLIGLQAFDDFSEDDIFDGIPYKYYLDFVQDLAGVSHKHLEYCLTLLNDKPKVDPYNILTYTWWEDKTAEQFSDALDIPLPAMKKIISCLTLSKENIIFYDEEIGCPPPPYFKLGDNQITRSLYGSMYGSLFYLRKELKRRFPRDYFNAVNKREFRFRTDLYRQFQGDRFARIEKEIEIKSEKGTTDIDAIVFDKKTKSLGLFQLKWQDIFAHNLKERYSRQSNLYPKSIEWIDKVENWLRNTSKKDIISKLKLQTSGDQVEDIKEAMIFVLARNHMHFTGQSLDSRAVWGSWHQIVYLNAKSKVLIDDPIKSLYFKLKLDSLDTRPANDTKVMVDSFELQFSNFSLAHKEEDEQSR